MINKTDLAPAVGADLAVMERDALRMRDGGPFVFAQVGNIISLFSINMKLFAFYLVEVAHSYEKSVNLICLSTLMYVFRALKYLRLITDLLLLLIR